MSHGDFEVKPVCTYEKPHYLSQSEGAPSTAPDNGADEKTTPLTIILSFFLVAIIIFGLVGCYMRSDYRTLDPPEDQPDGDPPDPPDCEEGTLRCANDWTIEVCVDEAWEGLDCYDYCVEEYGYEYWSRGCNAEADDPCQCEYDVLDGVMIECTPDDVYCVDEWNLQHCEEGWPETQSCHDWCQEHYGWEYTSLGCNDDADEICQCAYDIIDGGDIPCYPEDLYCIDDGTIAYCDPETGVSHQADCDDYCVELYGEGTPSTGSCNEDDRENPCGCMPDDSGSGSSD